MVQASIWKQTKQDPENEQKTFSEVLEEYMKAKGFSGAQLAEESNLSPAMISRMLNNTNSRGKPFHHKYEAIMAVSLALGIGKDGRDKLLVAAFPWLPVCEESLEIGRNVRKTNDILDERDLPLFGQELKE